MPNYKIVVHRDKIGTKPVYVDRSVDSRKLATIVYGLTTAYPGCAISFYPEENLTIVKNASIKEQLRKIQAQ